jgi:hypothetical protein
MLLLAHQLGHVTDGAVVEEPAAGASAHRWFRVFAVAFLAGLLWN